MRTFVMAALAGGVGACALVRASTQCASVNPMGTPQAGVAPSISADGRFVAFGSFADSIVPNDTNNAHDVFVRDMLTGQTTRVSVATGGAQSHELFGPDYKYLSISGDGRFVAFESSATDLAPGDTGFSTHIYVHDRTTGVTERVSRNGAGEPGNGGSFAPSVSHDGRFVAFVSSASNLVAGDTNDNQDAFLHDRATGVTRRVSVQAGGLQSSEGLNNQFIDGHTVAVSGDGRFVAFSASGADFVPGDTDFSIDVFVHDVLTQQTECVSVDAQGGPADDSSQFWPGYLSISADGRFVVFESDSPYLVAGDSNQRRDIFVRDRLLAQTTRVSVSSDGAETSEADSTSPAISPDGRFVSFCSHDSTLAPDDTNGARDVFIHDRSTGLTTRASVRNSGAQSEWDDGLVFEPMFSATSNGGRFVAFESGASDLVDAAGLKFQTNVFVRDRGALPCPGDTNGDNVIDFQDLNAVVSSFNTASADPGYNPAADIDSDGDVDFADLNVVVSAFNTDC